VDPKWVSQDEIIKEQQRKARILKIGAKRPVEDAVIRLEKAPA